jgi:3-oxoacyl-[acyl-carrier-protein] synthase II
MSQTVCITGVGTATSLGFDYPTLSRNLLNGVSGITSINKFDTTKHPSRIAGCLGTIPTPFGWDAESFAKLGHWEQLLLWCSVNALQDSGWWDKRDTIRIGLVIGLGAEWLLTWEADMHQGGDRVQHPERDTTGRSQWLHDQLGLRGPISTVAAACASGNIALGVGRMWVQRDWVDVCLAGACDRSVTPMGMAGFGNLGALSKRNHDPKAASRPFDQNRDGFVMSEGGAMYLLERPEKARKRGSKVYAEIIGFGASSDAFHMAIPSSDPGPAAKAIRLSLQDAELHPEQIDYINAHATSTTVGDPFETRAIQTVFGEATKRIPLSSTKSMTGHLLSAAAAVEVLACLTAFDEEAIPPTINLQEIDPDCSGLCHVPNEAQEHSPNLVINNSFGFGGSNTCLVLKRAG